jgi:hypothetical protein
LSLTATTCPSRGVGTAIEDEDAITGFLDSSGSVGDYMRSWL